MSSIGTRIATLGCQGGTRVLVSEFKSFDQYRSKYNYLAGLTRRGWAYEHLRRNSSFQKEAFANQSGVITVRHLEKQVYLLDLLKHQPKAERWGLIFFPNPDHTALDADLFWSEKIYPNHIRVSVSRRRPGQVDEIYKLSTDICRLRQLTDLSGNEHVLIQGPSCAIQIRCTGLSLRSAEPVKMSYALSGPSVMEKQFKLIKESRRAYVPVDPKNLKWSPAALRLRNGIIALDVTEAGLPLKDAAIIIYGHDHVAAEWTAPEQHLKESLRQRLRRARHLRDGGYRQFLQKHL